MNALLPALLGGFALALIGLGLRAFRSARAARAEYRASRSARAAALLTDAGLDPESVRRLVAEEPV